MVIEDDKAELMRVHDEEMESVQLMVKNLQHLTESLQQELNVKVEHMVEMSVENSELRGKITYLEDSNVLAEGGVEAQKGSWMI